MHKKFIDIINERGYTEVVEVGVRHGESSAQILKDTEANLVGIDIKYDEQANKAYADYPERSSYLIMNSELASSLFENNSKDAIYLDAGHSKEDVKKDVYSWLPKLKSGGMMFGDDYLVCNNPTEGQYGVVEFIEDFVADAGLHLMVAGHEGLNREERVLLAEQNGKKVEDNLWLSHAYLFPASAVEGRVRTEDFELLSWYFFK